MRDAGGDARPTSLLIRGLVKVELRYDLRASEGEADSLLALWLTAPPARSGGASEEYPFSRLSTTLTASVLYGVFRAEEGGADDFSGIVEADPTPPLLSTCIFGPAGVLTGT